MARWGLSVSAVVTLLAVGGCSHSESGAPATAPAAPPQASVLTTTSTIPLSDGASLASTFGQEALSLMGHTADASETARFVTEYQSQERDCLEAATAAHCAQILATPAQWADDDLEQWNSSDIAAWRQEQAQAQARAAYEAACEEPSTTIPPELDGAPNLAGRSVVVIDPACPVGSPANP